MPLIRIGHSPDPDDAFMFYALTAGKVKAGDIDVEHVLEDIESLNRRARTAELEVSLVTAAAPARHGHTGGGPITRAFSDALHALDEILAVALVALAILLPFALVALALWWSTTALRQRARERALRAA